MKIKTSMGERIFNVCNIIFLVALSLLCLYPIWHVLMGSLSSPDAMYSHTGLLLWPKDFVLSSYEQVLQDEDILIGYTNTLKVLVLGVGTQMILTTLCAYCMSRRDFLLRRPIMLMITFTMFFSGGMIPIYMNIVQLGLLDRVWGLILPLGMSTYNMIILRTSIEALPDSLLEAAEIDGAGHLTMLWKIVLPLTKATLAVLVMYYGVAWWNEWFWSLRVLGGKEKSTLAVVLRKILIEDSLDSDSAGESVGDSVKYATIMVSTIPILCIYPFIQKYFTKGVMLGAVKQ